MKKEKKRKEKKRKEKRKKKKKKKKKDGFHAVVNTCRQRWQFIVATCNELVVEITGCSSTMR